jgi:serine phosphatase RsbU (regulator of sigma subunit)
MPLDAAYTMSETPIGIFPAAHRDRNDRVNEIELLSSGDILLLATDGLTEHGEGRFLEETLEGALEGVKDRTAAEICSRLADALLAFGPQTDDITFVVIKRL